MQQMLESLMKPRRKNDFYETPPVFTRILLEDIEYHIGIKILECCNGDGAISNVLKKKGYDVVTNDIGRDADTHYDATQDALWSRYSGNVSWVISNPPFKSAPTIVQKAYHTAQHGVAMLLRLTFLEPCQNRGDFLSKHPPNLIVLPRHSFTGDGGVDSVTCAWFYWIKSLDDLLIANRFITKDQLKDKGIN